MYKGKFSQKLVFVILFSILATQANCNTKKYMKIKASRVFSKITNELEADYIILDRTEKRDLKETIKEFMGKNKKITYNKRTKKIITNMINFFIGDTYE